MLPPILLYTHSDYSFVWKATISLLIKYAPQFTIHWCSDKLLDFVLPDNFIYHEYDAKNNWGNRIKECVEFLETEYLIYIQEDWLLTDRIESEKVDYCIEYMKENNIDFLMSYLRGKIDDPIPSKYDNYVFRKITGHYMQPAIWKKELFKKIVLLDLPIHQYELYRANLISEAANCYAIEYTKTKDVSIPTLYFPHMHAICGGKWTFIRYPQLKELLESLGVDVTKHGICHGWITDYQ